MALSGVISLLDEDHNKRIEALWDEVAMRTGLQRPQPPIAHLSYHVAQQYDRALLEPSLSRYAENTRPFTLATAGLGLFTLPQPVIYLAVVKNLELARFQRWLWYEVSGTTTSGLDYYTPDNWVPHITLFQQGLDETNIGEALALLSGRDFAWTITIQSLGLLEPTETEEQRPTFNFRLGTAEQPRRQ